MSPPFVLANFAAGPPHATEPLAASDATASTIPTPHSQALTLMAAQRSKYQAVASSPPLSASSSSAAPWHFLNLRPLPHGHGSLRPIFGPSRRTGCTVTRG